MMVWITVYSTGGKQLSYPIFKYHGNKSPNKSGQDSEAT